MTIEEAIGLVRQRCEFVRKAVLAGGVPHELGVLADSVELLALVTERLADYLDGKDENLFVMHLQVGP